MGTYVGFAAFPKGQTHLNLITSPFPDTPFILCTLYSPPSVDVIPLILVCFQGNICLDLPSTLNIAMGFVLGTYKARFSTNLSGFIRSVPAKTERQLNSVSQSKVVKQNKIFSKAAQMTAIRNETRRPTDSPRSSTHASTNSRRSRDHLVHRKTNSMLKQLGSEFPHPPCDPLYHVSGRSQHY